MRQATLAGAEVAARERQRGQGFVASAAVRGFLFGPGQVGLAAGRERGFQFLGAQALLQHGLVLCGGVHVHQRQVQPLQAAFTAQQRAVGVQLRPVQRAAVLGHGVGSAADGLDLLQSHRLRVVAVGAAAHAKAAAAAFQHHLAFVGGAAPGDDCGLPHQAFQRGGGRCEAAVQVAALRGEGAQPAHGDRAGPRRHGRVYSGRVTSASVGSGWPAIAASTAASLAAMSRPCAVYQSGA